MRSDDQTFVDDQTFFDDIEGYPSALSVAPGELVDIFVSTRAETWSLRVERWGAERVAVYERTGLAGEHHEVPVDADANGCGWPVGHQIAVGEDWQSGFYLVTLTAAGADPERSTAHAGFVVRGGASSDASTLYVVPTNTWNAYNTWGGKSLYTGGTAVSFHRPFARGMLCRPVPPGDERDDRKARPTRFGEVPDADGEVFQAYRTANNYPSGIGSTGWYSHGRRFVEWAEVDGFTFDYAVSSDLETVPNLLDRYDTVVLVGHDEYWSGPERAAVEQHVNGGGRLVSFSGNTMFWKVRHSTGTNSGPTIVCYKYASVPDPDSGSEGDLGENDPHHPGPVTGMWADPLIGQPEWSLLGAGSAFGLYHRFGQATPRGVGGYLVSRPDHWLFRGTGLRYGDVVGRNEGAVGYETVGCPLTLDDYHQPHPSEDARHRGVPESTTIVGWVPASNVGVGEYPKSIAALSDQGDLEFIADRVFADDPDPLRRARNGNSVMATVGNNVVTIGTTDWVFALASDTHVQQITRNALSGPAHLRA